MKQLSIVSLIVLASISSPAQEFEWHQVQRPGIGAADGEVMRVPFALGKNRKVLADDYRWSTEDGGKNWSFDGWCRSCYVYSYPYPLSVANGFYFYSDSLGFYRFNENSKVWDTVYQARLVFTLNNTLYPRSVVFAGIGDTGMVAMISSPIEVFYSSDDGLTWTKKSQSFTDTSYYVGYRSLDHQGRIFIDAPTVDGSGLTLYVSEDMGITWDSVYSSASRGRINSMTHMHNGIAYATTFDEQWWLLASDTEGRNWRTVTSLDEYATNSQNYSKGALYFRVSSGPRSVLFLTYHRPYAKDGLLNPLRSTDDGASWHSLPRSADASFSGDLPLVDSSGRVYVHGIIKGVTEHDFQPRVFVSNNDGTTWAVGGYPHYYVKSFLHDAARDVTLMLGGIPWRYSGSAFLGSDFSLAYTLSDSLQNVQSLFHRRSGSSLDTMVSHLFNINGAYVAHASYQNYPGAGQTTQLLVSTNAGSSWIAKEYPPGFATTRFGTHQNALYALTTSYDVFKSVDLGTTWEPLISGFNNMPDVTAFGISPDLDFYVGARGLIYRDRELYFKRLYPALGSQTVVTCFAFDSIGNVYAATDKDGILRSNDKGEHWKFINTGLPDTTVAAMMVTPSGKILAATYDGLFMMAQEDSVWENAGAGLNDRWVLSLGMIDDETYLVGTANSGIYTNKRFPTPPLSVKLPPSVRLERSSGSTSYPNPFTTSTTIRFAVSEPSWVSIEVFSLLGERVAVLENAHHDQGVYETSFTEDGIPAGTYLYRLKIGAQSEVGRLIKTK